LDQLEIKHKKSSVEQSFRQVTDLLGNKDVCTKYLQYASAICFAQQHFWRCCGKPVGHLDDWHKNLFHQVSSSKFYGDKVGMSFTTYEHW
jgi:hypothetical protein